MSNYGNPFGGGINSPQKAAQESQKQQIDINVEGLMMMPEMGGEQGKKPKQSPVKMAALGIFLLFVVSIGVSYYSFTNEGSVGSWGNGHELRNTASSRSVDAARSEAGFFARFFCRGSQKSTFCR
ncbi:hypothetical protein BVY02_00860 [bacterium J17]|nr:hypothetical protein BVY02_00860 [bacterium J17]